MEFRIPTPKTTAVVSAAAMMANTTPENGEILISHLSLSLGPDHQFHIYAKHVPSENNIFPETKKCCTLFICSVT